MNLLIQNTKLVKNFLMAKSKIMEYVVWSMEYVRAQGAIEGGAYIMEYGAYTMEYGAYTMEYGGWIMDYVMSDGAAHTRRQNCCAESNFLNTLIFLRGIAAR